MIVVRTGRIRLFLLTLGSLAFVGLGLLFVLRPPLGLPLARELMMALGFVTLLFFGVAGGVLLRRLFGHRIALVIDRNGIVDNSTATPAGRVAWEEMTRIGIFEAARGARFIGIDVRDREALYARAKRPAMLRENVRMYDYPVQISEIALDRRAEEMLAFLEECRFNKKTRSQLGEMGPDLR
jgi:hypothetical protein